MRQLQAMLWLVLVAVPAVAGDIVPLIAGLQWVYEDPAGNTKTVTTVGWTEFAGATCMQIRVEMTGPHPQAFDQFRSRGSEGQIYYHGSTSSDLTVILDPPVLEYDPPLEVGRSWSTETTLNGQPFVFAYLVQSLGPVFVPYGGFDAYRIAFLNGGEWFAGQFVVPGIGEVERGVFELVSYGWVSPVERRNWSRVKELFR